MSIYEFGSSLLGDEKRVKFLQNQAERNEKCLDEISRTKLNLTAEFVRKGDNLYLYLRPFDIKIGKLIFADSWRSEWKFKVKKRFFWKTISQNRLKWPFTAFMEWLDGKETLY
jgi:hypothetical protein